ncbi:MAG TPA: hypothetical protein VGC79_29475, partial [Polyangiaceae bacterium]
MRLPVRLASLVCALLSLLLGPRWAKAESGLKLEAVPVLGANSPSVDGWGEVYVRLENSGITPLNGYVELRSLVVGRSALRTLSRAPFSIAAKARVNLLLPSHNLLRMGEVRVAAVDAHGEELSNEALAALRTLDPLLFDLHSPSRLAPVLNTQPVPIRRRAGTYAFGSSTLSVTTPQTNATTGELVLPDLAAGYASATLVLASGRTLSSLPQSSLDALFSWVLAGGALALVVDRPEDVHSAWLEALAGGH